MAAGATAFTVIPLLDKLRAKTFVNASCPALDAQ
jgi:hypothetical protein